MPPQPSQRGALFTLLLTVFIDMVGFGIIIPLTPFWAERFGASPAQVTLLFATYSGFAFVFSFVWGWISDRWGRKPVLILSLMGSVMSFAWLGMADALWMLFAARATGGIFGANIAVAQAYIADVTAPEDRAKGMGMMGAAFGAGFVLGPAIGGLLAGPDAANPEFRLPFFVAAGVSFVAVVVGIVFLREPERHAEASIPRGAIERFRGFAAVMSHPRVAWPLAVIVMMAVVMAGLESTLALWAERAHQWGPREIAFFFTYIGVLLVVVQGGLVRLALKRFDEAACTPFAVLAMTLGIGMIPWCETVWLVYLSGALIAFGYGLGNPLLNALISKGAPGDVQGVVLGASQSAQSLCRILGPVTAGALFAAFDRDMPYYVGGAILVVATFTALRIAGTRTGGG
jgi:DHA1 family tetracycline resistance protein-like MFS transporter